MNQKDVYTFSGDYANSILDLIEWCRKEGTYRENEPEYHVLDRIKKICIDSEIDDTHYGDICFNKEEVSALDDCLYDYIVNRQGRPDQDFSESMIRNLPIYKKLNQCIEAITGVKRLIWEEYK